MKTTNIPMAKVIGNSAAGPSIGLALIDIMHTRFGFAMSYAESILVVGAVSFIIGYLIPEPLIMEARKVLKETREALG